MLEVVEHGLLLVANLRVQGNVLPTARPTYPEMLALWLDSFWRSGNNGFDLALIVFGFVRGVTERHLFARQCAINKHSFAVNTRYTQTFQGQGFNGSFH